MMDIYILKLGQHIQDNFYKHDLQLIQIQIELINIKN